MDIYGPPFGNLFFLNGMTSCLDATRRNSFSGKVYLNNQVFYNLRHATRCFRFFHRNKNCDPVSSHLPCAWPQNAT